MKCGGNGCGGHEVRQGRAAAVPKTVVYLYEGRFHATGARMSGIMRFAQRSGWNLRSLEAIRPGRDIVRDCAYWESVGIIVEGGLASRRRLLSDLKRTGLPVVWCDADPEALPAGSFVVRHDSSKTAGIVLDRLLELERPRSYGFVSAAVRCDWSSLRENAFRERMTAAGREHSVFDLAAASRVGKARDCIRQLGGWLGRLRRPCGIFAANDEVGRLVLIAAACARLEVPKDVAVISIDNDEFVCENTTPTLASVEPNFEESGFLAAQLLGLRLADPAVPPQVVGYGCGDVVPRASIRQFERIDHAVLKAVEFIRHNACRKISVVSVADVMKTGRRSAEIHFRLQTGHSIQDEIDDVRFRTACFQLRRGGFPLKALHMHCGFSSSRALRNLFLKKCGLSPTAWLERVDRR